MAVSCVGGRVWVQVDGSFAFGVNCTRIMEALVGHSTGARTPLCSPATTVVIVDPSSDVIIGVVFSGGGDEAEESMECASKSCASGVDILEAAGRFNQI
mmetsp:Transcript_4532/g.10138  ORF Transcript_4532/g.10138 Transcript_4532/m.10138 type:complete len:99 (-) Transcript_4532:795-1091(-)